MNKLPFVKCLMLLVLMFFLTQAAFPQTTTFAQFSETDGTQDFLFTNNAGASGTFSTIGGGSALDFKYFNIAGLHPSLTGFQQAHITVLSTTNQPSFLSGSTLTQPFDQNVTISIIRDTPAPIGRNSRTNLLTAVITQAGSMPSLSGNSGGNSSTFSATTPDHVVTFTSDFLNFNSTTARNAALGFSSVQPNFSQGAGNFLANLTAVGVGTFASNPVPTSIMSIGNRVWYDTNNNGIIDPVEVGIPGISLSVFTDAGCDNTPDGGALDTVTSDANGYYRFDNLEAGCYLVRVNPSNFNGGVLEQYQNTNANNTANVESFGAASNAENGIDPASVIGTDSNSKRINGVWSNMITLTPAGSPTSEADVPSTGTYAGQGAGDSNANMTVDFGFYELCLCGTVWLDTGAGANFDNGILDGDEAGIPNVVVRIYDGLGNPVPVGPDGYLGTADDGTNGVLTDASGTYHFRGLLEGDYRVAVSNGTSSTPTTLDPNPNVDNDDNGFPTGSAVGSIPAGNTITNPITMTPRGEPLFNDADGSTANTTLDLGFILAPTYVKMSSMKAERVNGGVGITWESGYESENLGYQVYREVGGSRQLVNRDLIAGNALKTGTDLTAGDTYRFFDKGSDSEAVYYIEAIDSKGQTETFGPIYVENGNERMTFKSDSPLMVDLNKFSGVENQTESVAVKASKAVNSRGLKSVKTTAVSSFAGDGKALKMEISQDGWYQVSWKELLATGLNPSMRENWRLFVDGREEAIFIDPNSRGNIEFYGRGIDTAETTARVYWLIEGDKPGKRINRLKAEFDGNAQNTWNNFVAERRDKSFRASGILNGELENWYSMIVTPSGANQTFNLSSIAADSGQTARVSVDIQGATEGEHRLVISLNGAEIGSDTYSAMNRKTVSFDVPLTALQEGLNTVNLKALGAGFDVQFVEAMRITYPRRLVATNDKLSMSLEAGQSARIDGFAGSSVRLFDVSDSSNVSELWLQGEQQKDGTYSFTVPAQALAKQYLAMGNARALKPYLEVNQASDLRNAQNEADFIIISPREFQNSLQVLKAAREAEGLKTMLVDVTDIFDEFNGGMRSAKAIKDFLQLAKTNWKTKPSYVLFAGDASVDPKGYTTAGGAVSNKVPTMLVDTEFLETSSDESLVDFNNDGNGEIAFGRLPVRTVTELNAVLSKILGIKALTQEEIVQRGVLFVTDSTTDYDFIGATNRLGNMLPSGTNVRIVKKSDGTADEVRSQITNAINNGAVMVNYFGHGTTAGWTGSNILRSQDAATLNNQRPVLMTMFTCLNGNFTELTNESIAEAMFKREQGGAFAVLASSAMNYADVQEQMNRVLYKALLNKARLGDAARESKATLGNLSHKRTWILLGDPTQKVVR